MIDNQRIVDLDDGVQDSRDKPRHEGNYYQEVSLHIIYCWSILHSVEPNNKPLSSQDIASSVNRKLDTFTFTFSSWIHHKQLDLKIIGYIFKNFIKHFFGY